MSALEYPYDYVAYRIPQLIHLRLCIRSAKLPCQYQKVWANECAKDREVSSSLVSHGVTTVKSPMLHSGAIPRNVQHILHTMAK